MFPPAQDSGSHELCLSGERDIAHYTQATNAWTYYTYNGRAQRYVFASCRNRREMNGEPSGVQSCGRSSQLVTYFFFFFQNELQAFKSITT
jgi:hypothetical protein